MDAAQIALLEAELRKDLEALERVKKLMQSKGTLQNGNGHASSIPAADNEDPSLDEGPVTSLRGKIEEVLNADPSVKWTTQRVLAHLRKTGFPLKAKKPIYSIGQSLNKLTEQGRIRMVRRGTGSTPNIYKGRVMENSEMEGHVEDSQVSLLSEN